MLSLAPGSACDVCLEPFGAELKAPCSIPCGHVFCVNCLHQVARPSCPLCRTPFDTRQTIKLHIDLDSISPSSLELTPPSNADDGARQLQNRITQLAATGGSERDTTELTADCKKFLLTYSDLRTSYKMLFYMCNIKRNFLAQGSEVKDLQRNLTSLTQEVDRLKAALEVLKIEKRRSEEAWQTVSGERDDFSAECDQLHEHLDSAQSQILLLTE
ncbi:hypothetical protein K438DRAFT_1582265 [Mycena galopus ATCC 62051]|nr:hypothetical protein K438DRAFT_1582265 [Mycena galopus ATCC 62051]